MALKITTQEFELLSSLLFELTGIFYDLKKKYLFESRLQNVCKKFNFKSYADLYRSVKSKASSPIVDEMVNALSTNETLFFRDSKPFEFIEKSILPKFVSKFTSVPLRIWSAASSTGQEAYSLAMLVQENLVDVQSRNDISIVGTDINSTTLEIARNGKYNSVEVSRGLDNKRVLRHFRKDGDWYIVNESLRKMTSFKKANITEAGLFLGTKDLILCRNVAIYFSHETKRKLYENLYKNLADDGFLLIGATEAINEEDLFSRHFENGIIYYKKRT